MLFLAAAPVSAGGLIVRIDDGHGKPAGDAVVTAHREGESGLDPHAAGERAAATRIIDQRDETFIPYVEIFRPGDQVVFRNSDRTRHHVYSFSPAKTFEFVIAPGASTPPVTLDQVGEISVGCNIHDQMITHLFVSDAQWIARSTADGNAVIEGLPAGTYVVQVWHPQLRPGNPEPRQTLVVGDTQVSAAFSLALLPDPRQGAGDRERNRY
jgi:plastocyanin